MSFPTVTETGGSSAAATSHDITLPSAAIGDLLIVFVGNRTATYPTHTWTFDASTTAYTELYQASGPFTNSSRSVCKYRIVRAGDSNIGATGTLTIGLSLSRAIEYSVLLIPAATWHGSTPPESVFSTGPSVPGATTFNPGTLTPSWGAGDTLWLVQAISYSGIATEPTNYTAFTARPMRTAWRQRNAASEDPGNYTYIANTYWTGGTVGVRWNDATGIIGTPVFRRLLAARRRVLVP